MNKVVKAIWELEEKGEIDILTARYYSRLIHLAESVVLIGERNVDLTKIGENYIESVFKGGMGNV